MKILIFVLILLITIVSNREFIVDFQELKKILDIFKNESVIES